MSDDYEARRAAVLRERGAFLDGVGYGSVWGGGDADAAAAIRYPMPKREPKVVKIAQHYRRMANGAMQTSFSPNGPWYSSEITLDIMRELVADADAQAREEGE